MKEYPMHCGRIALIDDEDYERVSTLSWRSQRCGRTFYALHNPKQPTTLKVVRMHRFILQISYIGKIAEVDHINGNGLDNRKSNLRVCSHAQNSRNRKKWEIPCSSKYKGVNFDKATGRWLTRVHSMGKTHVIGRFDTEEEGAIEYNKAAKRLFGEYARLNEL
jgi:hypothetical protein